MQALELLKVLSHGLLSFPITDFTAELEFDKAGYQKRLEWLAPYGATALFAAGGTGEYFSLHGEEYSQIVKTAVDTCAGTGVAILAGCGGPTRAAIAHAQEAERHDDRHRDRRGPGQPPGPRHGAMLPRTGGWGQGITGGRAGRRRRDRGTRASAARPRPPTNSAPDQ